MTDDETKQLLREMVELQRQQLGRLEQQDKLFERHLEHQEQAYADQVKRHNEAMDQYRIVQRARPWEVAIRAITMLGVLLLLVYVLLVR